MARRARLVRTGCLAAGVLATVGVAAVSRGPSHRVTPLATAASPTTAPPRSTSQLEAVNTDVRVEALGPAAEEQYPDRYGGVWLTGSLVNLAFTGADAAELARRLQVDRHLQEFSVRGVQVAHSLRELQPLADSITGAIPRWASRGVQIYEVGVHDIGNVVQVTVTTEQQAREITAAYPHAPLDVQVGSQPHTS